MPAEAVDREADREADEGALFAAPASSGAQAPSSPGAAGAAEAGRAADMVRAAVAAAKGGADAQAADRRAQREAQQAAERVDLVADLNPPQREAVEHRGGPLLIVAGAGSGKTRVLTRRIAHLLATGDARPGEILAITFTNKAAAEMRERVEVAVGPRARAMWVSTFHSACVRILRREADRLGMKSSFSIYDQADSLRLVTLVSRDLDLDPKRMPPRGLLNGISKLKNELIDPDAYRSQRRPTTPRRRWPTCTRPTSARLRPANAVDFDDLIGHDGGPAAGVPRRRRALPPAVPAHPRRRVPGHQPRPVRAGRASSSAGPTARSPPGELVVVGDSDQSIYAFRGADHPQHRGVRAPTSPTPVRSCSSRTTARPRPSCRRPTR